MRAVIDCARACVCYTGIENIGNSYKEDQKTSAINSSEMYLSFNLHLIFEMQKNKSLFC